MMCGVIFVGHVWVGFCWSCVGRFLLGMRGLVFDGRVESGPLKILGIK